MSSGHTNLHALQTFHTRRTFSSTPSSVAMDVCKDLDQYAQFMQKHRRILQDAKKKQGQRPHDRKDRDTLLFEFMMASIHTARSINGQNERHLHSSFVPLAYLPCATSLDDLKPVMIEELRLETHHRGRYLLLRAITSPYRMTGILVLAEDGHGDATLLQLYQQEDEAIRPVTDIVEEGSILIIKEPFFKVAASGDYSVRVDHLSDIVHLTYENSRVPSMWRPRLLEIERSAESLKLEGNTLLGQGKHWRAIEK